MEPELELQDKQASVHLLNESLGYVYPAALRAAALLGVADRLVEGPASASELASATGSKPELLSRLLRYLATRDVFRSDSEGRWHLTRYAQQLRSDSPTSVRAAIISMTSGNAWLPMAKLARTVQDGRPAFEHVFGRSLFETLAIDPDASRAFQSGMSAFTESVHEDGVLAYDFADAQVIDIGGGDGTLLLQLLRKYPSMKGVLFEARQVLEEHVLRELGDDDRWEVVAGDFFTTVPKGGNVYLLKWILHDWADSQCVQILRNCRRAMAPGGRILIAEAVIPPGDDDHPGKLMDMLMMALLPGRERTVGEYAELLQAAGLQMVKVTPTEGPLSIIEGRLA